MHQRHTRKHWRLGEVRVPAHLVVLVGGDATIERRDDGALDHLPLGRRAGQEQLDGSRMRTRSTRQDRAGERRVGESLPRTTTWPSRPATAC